MNQQKLETICMWKEVFSHNGHDTHQEHDVLVSPSEDCYHCDGYNKKCEDYVEVYRRGE